MFLLREMVERDQGKKGNRKNRNREKSSKTDRV